MALNGVILGCPEIMLYPEACDLALIFCGMGAVLIVVRPHDIPFQVLSEACFVKGLHPVFETAHALIPVPIHAKAGNAVFHRPFDLPVDDFRIAFVIPSQQGFDFGSGFFDLIPFRPLFRSRIVKG